MAYDVFAFPPATLAFLRDLRDNNTREWFEAHRADYRAAYVEPAKELVEAVAPLLRELAPGINAEPRVLGSIFRINRDTRFSKDKRPYKDHLDLWFWEGERRAATSGFFLRVTPTELIVGAGAHGLQRAALERFRAAVADEASGAELARIADALEEAGVEPRGARYKRTPPGYAADGPAARFLLHDALYAHATEPAAVALDAARLIPTCHAHWTRMAPLHRWLSEHVERRV
jgi:uncharacterized protein (TIGR02453 family)